MSLLHCPECGHEVSSIAEICPNCGHPMQPPMVQPVVDRKVVVTRPPRDGFPTWAIFPIVLGGILLLFLAYLFLRSSSDETANTNVNVNVARRAAVSNSEMPLSETHTSTIPSTETGVSVPSEPTTITAPPPASTTTIASSAPPVSAPPPDKGTVVIQAKISSPRAGVQNVKSTKFYLLDKDIETILSSAGVDPIQGNTLTGSLGLASVYPDRFGDFQRAAMRAIASHVKYSGTTDGTGSAKVGNVAPKEYYLFGITRAGRGFAIWDAPISITPGDNVLDLSPQDITEIPEPSSTGEGF